MNILDSRKEYVKSPAFVDYLVERMTEPSVTTLLTVVGMNLVGTNEMDDAFIDFLVEHLDEIKETACDVLLLTQFREKQLLSTRRIGFN